MFMNQFEQRLFIAYATRNRKSTKKQTDEQ